MKTASKKLLILALRIVASAAFVASFVMAHDEAYFLQCIGLFGIVALCGWGLDKLGGITHY